MLGLESMEIAFSGLGFLGGSSSFCEVIDWNLDPLLEAWAMMGTDVKTRGLLETLDCVAWICDTSMRK